ncbi:hypothetical protein BAE44_0017436 [Dichanthelium oligosanthes]|uniref:Uncharacterized protein n=1 Tax=Dichanthelium oligosanthes TaxID=888268 RepID=A0A1E5V8R1_9POAL|nr:hypothetical protein BAE44_0017436 [Dichanthelium oligosanthes]
MACSKKTLGVLIVPLLMALLAASVSTEICGHVPHCDVNQCEASCFVTGHQGGTCKIIRGAPSCCCAGSSASIGVHQMACSKKTLVFLVVVPLLMALLAASSVSAEICGQVPHCDVNQCGASCFVTGHQGGACKLLGGAPSCC